MAGGHVFHSLTAPKLEKRNANWLQIWIRCYSALKIIGLFWHVGLLPKETSPLFSIKTRTGWFLNGGINSVKSFRISWLWGKDLNLRPLGYEANVSLGVGWRGLVNRAFLARPIGVGWREIGYSFGYSAWSLDKLNSCTG